MLLYFLTFKFYRHFRITISLSTLLSYFICCHKVSIREFVAGVNLVWGSPSGTLKKVKQLFTKKQTILYEKHSWLCRIRKPSIKILNFAPSTVWEHMKSESNAFITSTLRIDIYNFMILLKITEKYNTLVFNRQTNYIYSRISRVDEL